TSNSWVSYSKRPPTADSIQAMSDRIADAPVEVVVELAETTISTADLINLRVGDIIATEKDIAEPLVVSVEGKTKFFAKPGQYKGRKAIEILGQCEETHIRYSASSAPTASKTAG